MKRYLVVDGEWKEAPPPGEAREVNPAWTTPAYPPYVMLGRTGLRLVTKAAQKGEKHGECNRTACNNPTALWWNKSTQRYYCQSCALRIMSWRENKGLLTREEPEDSRAIYFRDAGHWEVGAKWVSDDVLVVDVPPTSKLAHANGMRLTPCERGEWAEDNSGYV